jgi:DNA-binding CsgD family transcriptional regulator
MMLTAAEATVARLYAAGLRQTAIAERHGLHRRTIGEQLTRACRKLNVERDDRRALAVALVDAPIGWQRGRIAGRKIGWSKGDALWIVGGKYAGRTATFVRLEGARQVSVRIGGAVVAVLRANVRRVVDAVAA